VTSESFWDRMAEIDNELGRKPTLKKDRAAIDAMADRISSATDSVDDWDSPALYQVPNGRRRCREVLKAHRFIGTQDVDYRTAEWDLMPGDSKSLVDLPPFNPDNADHQAAPRLIFAKNPRVVRVFRGAVPRRASAPRQA
jgi:hypothetical protein